METDGVPEAAAPERGFIRESYEHVLPKQVRDLLPTTRRLLFDHHRFFAEVFAGNWSDKLHPTAFFVACFALSVTVLELVAVEKPDLKVPEWAIPLLFMAFYAPQFALIHRFLKVPHRTRKQTIYVLTYTTSLGILLGAIPSGIINSKYLVHIPQLQVVLALLVIAVSIWMYLKQFRIIKLTHGVGFWRYTWAATRAGLVMVLPLVVLGAGVAVVTGAGNQAAASEDSNVDPEVTPDPSPEPRPSPPAPASPPDQPPIVKDPPIVAQGPRPAAEPPALAFAGTWRSRMAVRVTCAGESREDVVDSSLAMTASPDGQLQVVDLSTGGAGVLFSVRGRSATAAGPQVISTEEGVLTASRIVMRRSSRILAHLDIDGTFTVAGSPVVCLYVGRATLSRDAL